MLDGIANALLILNPQAGRARKLPGKQIERVQRTLAGHGIATELALVDAPGVAEEIARRAVRDGAQLVIVCGGDGTLNGVVNGLAGSHVPLALLPAGTANILAKELHVPWNIDRAAERIRSGTLRRIALGMLTTFDGGIHKRYFLSVAGAGPDGAMVHTVNEDLKRRIGMLAYFAEGARQFVSYTFPQFRVTSGSVSLTGALIVVGRTRHYGGPLLFTPRADLFGNDFALMIGASRNRLLHLAYAGLACVGGVKWAPHAHFLKTTAVRCEPLNSDAVWLQVDGEPAGCLPAEFHIVPDALTLVVPHS